MPRISEIISFLDGEGIPCVFEGDPSVHVAGFSSISHYKPGTLTWVKKYENIPKNFDLFQPALTIVSEGVVGAFSNVIRTAESKRAFFSTIEHFFGEDEQRPPIGRFTYISPKVKIGRNVRIGHNCTLDGDITIGDDTVIWNNVTIINRVVVGASCEIQSGAVIGHDGFGYTENGSKKTMIRHFGGVEIGDGVRIGCNTCICRGTIDDTRIESGTKIDNLSHIAHNCVIGKDVALAYPCSLGGSAQIGNGAYLAACAVRNQRSVGEEAFIGMGSVVVKDVEDGQTVAGVPAKPFEK